MDSITQATLGAAIGEAILGRKMGHKAAVVGAIVATIPDLDVMLTPFFSPLQNISIHRGYSHSILFTFVGSIVISLILSRIKWTRKIPIPTLWIFSFLVLFTHILLDTFTSYGTQLFLPVTDRRVSFDSIGIIDPLYTLPLLGGVLISLFYFKNAYRKRRIANTFGLIFSSVYLLFTLANKQHIEQVFNEQLQEQNIPAIELLTIPVKAGNIVWYGVAKDSSHLHIGKYSVFEKNKIQFESFPINDHLLDGLDKELVDRMKWFAKGFYTVAEYNGKIRVYNMQCDMQGIRKYGDYMAPTAFYFEIIPGSDDNYSLSSGMHKK